MSVPAIALYASPPGAVCSAAPHHSSQIAASHGASDLDLLSRPASSAAASSPSSSAAAQKPGAGGLSCLFSSTSAAAPAARHGPPSSFGAGCGDERSDELGCSYPYSSHAPSSSFKCRDHSPVSVFQGPVSCGGSGASRSPAVSRPPRDWLGSDWRVGRDRLFSGFVMNALGSCLDYVPPSFPIQGDIATDVGDLSFELDESLVEIEPICEPYAKELLIGAQSRHKIFYEELVVKAFYEAEKAHRGQVIDIFVSLNVLLITEVAIFWVVN